MSHGSLMLEPMRKGETVRRALLIEAGVAAVAAATPAGVPRAAY